MIRARHLLSLVLTAALIAGQWAGQLHALSHAEYDLAVAAHFKTGGDAPALLDHSRDRCVTFHALDCPVDAPALPLLDSPATAGIVASPRLPLRAAEHPAYSSHAPPVLRELC